MFRTNIKIIVYFSAVIYLCGVIAGIIISLTWFKNNDKNYYKEDIYFKLSKKEENEDYFKLILINNLRLVVILVLSALTFGSLALINLFYNGLILGIGLPSFKQQLLFLSLIVPHGIFEIPAIIIAGAAGFKIPYEIIRYLMGKKEQPLTKEDIKEYFKLALISIILIVIAAFVEAYVTPKIAEYFLSNLD